MTKRSAYFSKAEDSLGTVPLINMNEALRPAPGPAPHKDGVPQILIGAGGLVGKR